MKWARVGIQRRIMAYVAVGLGMIFGTFFYLGLDAVRRSTDLVFQERRAMAESTARAVGQVLDHIRNDLGSDLEEGPGEDWQERAAHAYRHLRSSDRLPLFRVVGVAVVDAQGRALAGVGALPEGDGPPPPEPWAEAVYLPDGSPAVRVSLPIRGNRYGVAYLLPMSRRSPFIPFGSLAVEGDDSVASLARYRLELLSRDGRPVLNLGSEEDPDVPSLHTPLVRGWMERGEAGVVLHRVPGGGRDHVMAVVPVPGSALYLVLEQDRDRALALPSRFRRTLVAFSLVAFGVTLLVAWVTTRHVVRPTEQLTREAVRMAQGDLSRPIRVRAQDEIGELAAALEQMRQQLRHALQRVEEMNRDLERRVQERTRQLQALVRRILTAQEEERRRVSLELHDETAQVLTALTMTLDSLARKEGGLQPRTRERLEAARRLARSALEGVRRLIQALRPVALEEMGLAAALRWQAEESLASQGIRVEVQAQGLSERLPEEVELALYRIGQEAIHNVARHSRARHARISLVQEGGVVVLTVEDDGVGFDPRTVQEAGGPGRGVGLEGMRERARLVGGRFLLRSAPGQGTTVRVEVPLDGRG